MNPVVSIIIPCYNSESTVEETLRSVLDQTFDSWEALIINDGSPDNIEDIALKWAEKDKRFKYHKKENGGLGSARNYGIEKAIGEFIVPLDSDNKIRPKFVENGVQILRKYEEVGVLYGDAMKFGDINERWNVGEFDILKILNHNYIDACSLIRRAVFDKVGFYDEKMPYQGHEDWEFWLRVTKNCFQFYYLKEIAFDYRTSPNSMIRSFNNEMVSKNEMYIKTKHSDLYIEYYSVLYHKYKVLKKQVLENKSLRRILRKYLKI